MDAKDLRTEAALGDRNDGNTKYAQAGSSLPCQRNKTYQDIGSNSLGKVDAATARPCAVIGPDRVVPPPASTDAYLKKGPPEPWLGPENTYRRPPDYPHKLIDYQLPTRNISPRQTFQENMQRIMVPPSYASAKLKEDHNFPGDPNVTQMRNNKLNVPIDPNTKYCDVPYNITMLNEQKNVRNTDLNVKNMNNVLTRNAPHRWPTASASVQATKPYPQEFCQYPEYLSCAGPRPMVMPRPNRTVHEEARPLYPEAYYHEGNIRYKPYPTVKERYPQPRYEYVSNYPNPFHPPPPFPSHKYELQKSLPAHHYPSYSQVPLKYSDGRMADPMMNGYQRTLNSQANYNNLPYRNQMIHPSYATVPGNCLQTNKYYPYPPEAGKALLPNKLPFADANGKIYPDYEANRPKNFHMPEGFYVNEMTRSYSIKGPSLPPNYAANLHAVSPHPYYRKESVKGFEYNLNPQFRGIDPTINGNLLSRFPNQFSPSTIAISPSDSNASNDTNQTHGTSQEDFGYISQSSTASIRSMDSGINRFASEYRQYDQRYTPIIKSAVPKHDQTLNNTKDKKDIDVRQFLQMWNEGEEEGSESNPKDIIIKPVPNNSSQNMNASNFETTNQEQLYVLGLVNVPSEELAKYEHIQKVSKLPENIKGYNNIELLHQFEEIIESSNLNYNKPTIQKDFHNSLKSTIPVHGISIPSRPLSPLDVEAKISQSVIHKEVGCNFEIKPCSPKMLNVETATPVHSILGERIIEKVSNPLIGQSPILKSSIEIRDDCNILLDGQERSVSREKPTEVASCKMVNPQYSNNEVVDTAKTNYSIQDLESNSGVCLASLPRLDNDIEFNFPEVNQQFINANKGETVITATSVKDLPTLENDPCETSEKSLEPVDNNVLDKDFSKLSKYRKLKRKSSEVIIPETNVQALRTDSVIIKNPENCKSQEIIVDKVPTPKLNHIEAQNDPINLSVTSDSRQIDVLQENIEMKDISSNIDDKAIDFSTSCNQNDEENAENTSFNTGESHMCKHDNQVINDQEKSCDISNVFQENDTIRSILESNNENATVSYENDKNVPHEEEKNKNNFSKKRKIHSKNFLPKMEPIGASDKMFSETMSCVKFDDTKQIDHSNEEESNKQKSPEYSMLETDDSINMKMRELFGELSVPEHDSCSIASPKNFEDEVIANLDDVVSNKVHQVFHQDHENSDNSGHIVHKSSDDDGNQYKICTERENKTHDLERNNSDLLNSVKKSIFDIDGEPHLQLNETNSSEKYVRNQDQSTETLDIIYYECDNLVKVERRTNKELLSPWIQKLIIFNEGHCNTPNESNEVDCCSVAPKLNNIGNNTIHHDSIDDIKHLIESNKPTEDNDKSKKEHDAIETLDENSCAKISMFDNGFSKATEEPFVKAVSNTEQYLTASNENDSSTKDYTQNFVGPVHDELDQTNSERLSKIKYDASPIIFNTVISDSLKDKEPLLKSHTDPVLHIESQCNIIKDNDSSDTEVISARDFSGKNDLELGQDHCVSGKSLGTINHSESLEIKNICGQIDDKCRFSHDFDPQQTQTNIDEETKTGVQDIPDQENLSKCTENDKSKFNLHINNNIADPENEHSSDNKDTVNSSTIGKSTVLDDKIQECQVAQENDSEMQEKLNVSLKSDQKDKLNGLENNLQTNLTSNKNQDSYQIKAQEIENSKLMLNLQLKDNKHCVNECPDIYPTSELIPETTLLPNKEVEVEQISEDGSTVKKESFHLSDNSNSHIFIDCVLDDAEKKGTVSTIPTASSKNDIFVETEPNCCENLFSTDLLDAQKLSIQSKEHKHSLRSDDSLIDNIPEDSTSNEYFESMKDLHTTKDIMLAVNEETNTQNDETLFITSKDDPSNAGATNSCIQSVDIRSNANSDDNSESIKPKEIIAVQNVGKMNPSSNRDTETKMHKIEKSHSSKMESCDLIRDFPEKLDESVLTAQLENEIIVNNDTNNILLFNQDHENESLETSETQKPPTENEIINTLDSRHDVLAIPPSENKIIGTSVNSRYEKEIIISDTHDLKLVNNSPQETKIHNDNLKSDDIVVNTTDDILDSGVVDGDSVFESPSIEGESLGNIRCKVDSLQETYNSKSFTAKRRSLKRSLSESAVDAIRSDSNDEIENSFMRPNKQKRKRLDYSDETHIFAENICHVLQNHRRNSMSSMNNEENVSFCILIDNNCIITEECSDSDKICFSTVPEDCIACVQQEAGNDEEESTIVQFQEVDGEYSTSIHVNEDFKEDWVEDIACIETVVSEDIAEDVVISASTSPRDSESEYEHSETEAYENEHTDKLKCIYGEKMQNEDARFVETLFRTPQMNVNQTLHNRESQIVDRCYDDESLEQILSNSLEEESTSNRIDFECTSPLPISSPEPGIPERSSTYDSEMPLLYESGEETSENRTLCSNKNVKINDLDKFSEMINSEHNLNHINCSKSKVEEIELKPICPCESRIDNEISPKPINSCESSIDDIFPSKITDKSSNFPISSSPEVSSTTSEEKNSGILLTITNYSRPRVPEVNDIGPVTSISCKYTEKKDYLSSSNKQYLNPNLSSRTLITKAAQKYIPPLKETRPDLKVKLPLPPHSLMKLREMKMAKELPKFNDDKNNGINIIQKGCSRKPKPKFEDVLKSIDEIQYQMHKEKSKKVRKSIPKVVIKKNENGSHYASTSSRDRYNPDLTGRKWQPWVFLEKNYFIDKMALKKKTRAIYSHRKNTYVLAEKFQKYKSANSTKFVISQPKYDDSIPGHLKYTIRLKHHY